MPKDGENNNHKWITITGSVKTKNLLNPKPKPKVHNAFAMLSQPGAPTNYNPSSPTRQMDDNKTIITPGPGEHHRRQKNARCQHIKQTLWQLRKSDDLFLDNSITHTKDKRIAIDKNNTNNAKRVAINSNHAQCNQPTSRVNMTTSSPPTIGTTNKGRERDKIKKELYMIASTKRNQST
jgi:hypothetical protein